jgi:hypothetical protein
MTVNIEELNTIFEELAPTCCTVCDGVPGIEPPHQVMPIDPNPLYPPSYKYVKAMKAIKTPKQDIPESMTFDSPTKAWQWVTGHIAHGYSAAYESHINENGVWNVTITFNNDL